jgi:hypothetical protein
MVKLLVNMFDAVRIYLPDRPSRVRIKRLPSTMPTTTNTGGTGRMPVCNNTRLHPGTEHAVASLVGQIVSIEADRPARTGETHSAAGRASCWVPVSVSRAPFVN